MHFGRVESFQGISLDLPTDHPRTERFLDLDWQGRGDIFSGAPIWGCPDWVGDVYPKNTRPKDYLYHYAKKFRSIELNSTFYHLPTLEQIDQWLKVVPAEFKFCPKMPQSISAKLLHGTFDAVLNDYFAVLERFDSKLGLPFAQLPETFDLEHLGALQALLLQIPKSVPMAFEFRHESFFDNGILKEPVMRLLYHNQKSVVITDTPGRRDVLHMTLTQPNTMIRFLGYFNSGKDEKRLRQWAKKVTSWAERGMDQIYFFIHQPNNMMIPPVVEYFDWKLYEQQRPSGFAH